MNEEIPGLGRGERAPDFVLPLNGTPTRFYALAGGTPSILVFCGDDEMNALLRFSETLNDSTSNGVSVFAVKSQEAESQPNDAGGKNIAFPVFSDVQGKVRSAYRLDAEEKAVVFLLNSNLRVLEARFFENAEISAQQVAATLDASVPRIEPRKIAMQAPVLLIPDVLDPEMCRHLIDVWENQGSVETGVEQSHGGRRQERISAEHKQRQDHVVMDKELMKRLTTTIGRRLMPEVRKAFVFRATRFEGFKIACYDAETGGFFHAHRDNLSPATAHRRFALTLNLNDDYEGGYLRFPEYGTHLYRPETGGALVFSCSNLHEVTKVTKGRRFALLSFLFGEGDVRASQARKK